jgi:drug/metabolite transporter (DMT)-like permease
LCSFWCWDIFFRVIKNFSLFLDKRQKSIYLSLNNAALDFKGMLLLILLCASWGFNHVAIKVAIEGISPVLQAGIRSIGAAFLVLIWMNLRRIPVLAKDHTLWWGIAVGLLFSIEFILIYWGLDFTNASRAVIWGATTVVIKAGPLASIAPSKTLLYQLAVSAIVLPAASPAFGEPGITNMTPLVVTSLFYQIVWIAFITYIAWFWLISNYAVSRPASFTFLTPFFGVIAGAIFLNEQITLYLICALVLVGTGIYLVNRR